MLTGEGIRSGEPASAAEQVDAPGHELLGAGQIPADPVSDAE